MKFLLDHDVPEDLSYLLEQLGHETALLREVLPPDAPDETVLRFAHENGSAGGIPPAAPKSYQTNPPSR